MAYIDITPSSVTNFAGTWTDINNVLVDDSTYALSASGAVNQLYVKLNNPTSLPQDIVITGMQIYYSAQVVSALAGANLKMKLVGWDPTTISSASVNTSALYTSGGTGYIGTSSTMPSGVPIPNRQNLIDNSHLGIIVYPDSTKLTVDYGIRYVSLRIHYTASTYLTGSRSVYTKDPLWGYNYLTSTPSKNYDVTMAGEIPNETSSLFKRKFNGTSAENQVKAIDVNKLGDALYNIEAAILDTTLVNNRILVIGNKKVYAFAITVTGNVVNTNYVVYQARRVDGTTTTNHTNVSNSVHTIIPLVSNRINCHWSSAVGWVTKTGTATGISVQADSITFERNSDGTIDYNFSFRALGTNIASIVNYDSYESPTGSYGGYVGSYSTATNVPSGVMTVKILALGTEV